jgi:uncharacterized protein with HEPN domain
MNRDEASLRDIAQACRLVVDFVGDQTYVSFLEDIRTQSAVQHQLLVIGEAVKRLTTEFRSQHADVPWSLIAGMRDHIIHAYDSVDLDEVWNTATSDIPELLARIGPLVK